MKKIVLLTVAILGITSCKNFDKDFPDFDYTTGYFPYQFPVRILVKGNYMYDNENDNNNTFVVSAAMGGVRENTQTRKFGFVIDESLCEGAFFEDGTPIIPLPEKYYTLSHQNEIIIPKGKMNGGVSVFLTDDFFDDPLAISNNYVLPVRITSVSKIDSLLQGKPLVNNADPRLVDHWETMPKSFTMFGIKFVNPFHGQYLYYGNAKMSENGTIVSDSTYRQTYVERNDVVFMETSGRKEVVSVNLGLRSGALSGFYRLKLTFDSENVNDGEITCTVSAYDEQGGYTVTGTGRFVNGGESFGGDKKDAIYLEYTLTTGNFTYEASETFVFRDKKVVLETYSPKITGL